MRHIPGLPPPAPAVSAPLPAPAAGGGIGSRAGFRYPWLIAVEVRVLSWPPPPPPRRAPRFRRFRPAASAVSRVAVGLRADGPPRGALGRIRRVCVSSSRSPLSSWARRIIPASIVRPLPRSGPVRAPDLNSASRAASRSRGTYSSREERAIWRERGRDTSSRRRRAVRGERERGGVVVFLAEPVAFRGGPREQPSATLAGRISACGRRPALCTCPRRGDAERTALAMVPRGRIPGDSGVNAARSATPSPRNGSSRGFPPPSLGPRLGSSRPRIFRWLCDEARKMGQAGR